VDDEGRGGDRGERLTRSTLVVQEVVVLRGPEVARVLDVAAGELAERRLVERALTSGEHAPVVDQVLSHRPGVRPVDLNGPDEPRELRGGRREGAIAGDRDRGADERERADALGEVEGEELRECAPSRDADDMRRGNAVRVENPGGVGD
jgi:hypothetical protein